MAFHRTFIPVSIGTQRVKIHQEILLSYNPKMKRQFFTDRSVLVASEHFDEHVAAVRDTAVDVRYRRRDSTKRSARRPRRRWRFCARRWTSWATARPACPRKRWAPSAIRKSSPCGRRNSRSSSRATANQWAPTVSQSNRRNLDQDPKCSSRCRRPFCLEEDEEKAKKLL